MKLIEMKQLPKKVGDAVISFGDEDLVPERKKVEIMLPGKPEMDFFWLNNNLQFLLYYYGKSYSDGSDRESKENPHC